MADAVTNQVLDAPPLPDGHDKEYIRATIDCGTSGGGSLANISLNGDYDGNPYITGDIVDAGQGEVTINNKTATDFDLVVTNGPASTTVTVDVHVAAAE